MAPVVPSTEPTVFTAGDTVKWTKAFADYPPSESWTLTYYFRGVSALDKAATGAPTDAVYSVTLAAADTAILKAGRYSWVAIVTKAGERYVAGRGVLTVLADVATADAGDLQTHAEKMLALIEQELYNRVSNQRSIETYQIDGRAISKIPIGDLKRLRGQYRGELAGLRNPGKFGVPVGAVFGRP